MTTAKIMGSTPRQFFLTGARFGFGIWLLYAGIAKWAIMGPDTFVGFITTEFAKTWSPAPLNTALAWLIMCAEPVLSIFLLMGCCQRVAWTLIALLMYLLLIGQTILMKPDVIANWQFFIFALACAALSGAESECCKEG